MKHFILLFLAFHAYAMEMDVFPVPTEDNGGFGTKTSLELDVFGLSYHSNRNYDFNEKNPGLGITAVFGSDRPDPGYHFSMTVSGGTYKDSYSNQATYLLAGPRLTLGYEESFHVSIAWSGGYIQGSGHHGQGLIPFAAIGYDRYSLGITGDPIGDKKKGEDDTKMVAIFLKFRVLDF